MPKGRRRPRWNPKVEDPYAFVPLTPRMDTPEVTVDETQRLSPARLEALLKEHGLECAPWMRELEARVGGMRFGEDYARVYLGFAPAFRRPFPRTPQTDEPLLLIGFEGDTHYYVNATNGEAWAQDGIADKFPHRECESFDALSAKLWWPAATRSAASPEEERET